MTITDRSYHHPDPTKRPIYSNIAHKLIDIATRVQSISNSWPSDHNPRNNDPQALLSRSEGQSLKP